MNEWGEGRHRSYTSDTTSKSIITRTRKEYTFKDRQFPPPPSLCISLFWSVPGRNGVDTIYHRTMRPKNIPLPFTNTHVRFTRHANLIIFAKDSTHNHHHQHSSRRPAEERHCDRLGKPGGPDLIHCSGSTDKVCSRSRFN